MKLRTVDQETPPIDDNTIHVERRIVPGYTVKIKGDSVWARIDKESLVRVIAKGKDDYSCSSKAGERVAFLREEPREGSQDGSNTIQPVNDDAVTESSYIVSEGSQKYLIFEFNERELLECVERSRRLKKARRKKLAPPIEAEAKEVASDERPRVSGFLATLRLVVEGGLRFPWF